METTYTKARNNLAGLWDKSVKSREPIYVSRRGSENIAIIPADELDSLLEIAHLFASPRNRSRLLRSLDEAKKGKTRPQTIEELKAELDV